MTGIVERIPSVFVRAEDFGTFDGTLSLASNDGSAPEALGNVTVASKAENGAANKNPAVPVLLIGFAILAYSHGHRQRAIELAIGFKIVSADRAPQDRAMVFTDRQGNEYHRNLTTHDVVLRGSDDEIAVIFGLGRFETLWTAGLTGGTTIEVFKGPR